MKKFIVIGLILGGMSIASSCGKEYTCTCLDASGNQTTETHKGSDAVDACNDATTLIPIKTCVPA
ncbi:MAG: hypothetical protein CL844_06090 [Crocinitomicaceae bacterium]|nr:hypothetical protein [Crocinitomicaceae bacterium]|tara:strand:- start:36090 stop:36284 length:195 start_codon:yes stop_codon:yes gene_type:complete